MKHTSWCCSLFLFTILLPDKLIGNYILRTFNPDFAQPYCAGSADIWMLISDKSLVWVGFRPGHSHGPYTQFVHFNAFQTVITISRFLVNPISVEAWLAGCSAAYHSFSKQQTLLSPPPALQQTYIHSACFKFPVVSHNYLFNEIFCSNKVNTILGLCSQPKPMNICLLNVWKAKLLHQTPAIWFVRRKMWKSKIR